MGLRQGLALRASSATVYRAPRAAAGANSAVDRTEAVKRADLAASKHLYRHRLSHICPTLRTPAQVVPAITAPFDPPQDADSYAEIALDALKIAASSDECGLTSGGC
jgi:hypothetical protein